MALKTDIQLNTQAEEVRDETVALANTALKVGTLFKDMNDSKLNRMATDPYSVAVADITGEITFGWMLKDSLGEDSIDVENRLLSRSDSIESLNWESMTLSCNGITTLAWWDTVLYDTLGNLSIEWQGRYAFDSSGNTSLNWENKTMLDNSSILSLDWATRALYSTTGAIIMDWQTDDSLTIWGEAFNLRGNNGFASAPFEYTGAGSTVLGYYGDHDYRLGKPELWIKLTKAGINYVVPAFEI